MTAARTLARLAFANAASAFYLGVVGCSVAVAAAVTWWGSDPGFVRVWPFFLTAPASLLAAAVGDAVWGTDRPPGWVLLGAITACALCQSLGLGALLALLRGRIG